MPLSLRRHRYLLKVAKQELRHSEDNKKKMELQQNQRSVDTYDVRCRALRLYISQLLKNFEQ